MPETAPPKESTSSLQARKKKTNRDRYNTELMTEILGISEEKILFSSKKLPEGWKSSTYFPKPSNDGSKNVRVKTVLKDIIAPIKKGESSFTLQQLQKNYQALISAVGEGTPEEMLFIRHARKYFVQKFT